MYGSTLVFAEKGALSDVANNLTIGKGSIVVEADVEDDVFPAMNANSMKLEVGNLTINKGEAFGKCERIYQYVYIKRISDRKYT